MVHPLYPRELVEDFLTGGSDLTWLGANLDAKSKPILERPGRYPNDIGRLRKTDERLPPPSPICDVSRDYSAGLQ